MRQRLKLIEYDWKHIPPMIKWMSLMLFFFVLGRGLGGDVYFSVYIETIVDNALRVSLLGSLLALSKMAFSLTVGNMNDRANFARILQSGKMLYVGCGFLFVLAGLTHQPVFLFLAVIANGVGSAMVFTTYQYYFSQHSDEHNRFAVLGLMYSAMFAAYVVGSLISSVLIQYMPLWSMYLFVSLFSLVSMRGWKRLEVDVDEKAKSLTRRLGVWRQMMIDVFSREPYHHSMNLFRDYGLPLISRLSLVALMRAIDYVGFLFIPILAVAENYSLSQIALLFAVMRVPPMLSYFIGDLEDKVPYRINLLVGLGGLGLVFVGLAYTHHFGVLIALGVIMGLLLTILRPLLTGDVLAHTRSKDAGSTSGLIGVSSRLGEIIGSMAFGIIASLGSMQAAFGVFAGIILLVFFYFLLTFYKK